MGTLRNLLLTVITISVVVGCLISLLFSYELSKETSSFYKKNCEHVTFLAAKNLQYALGLYANDALIYQNLQNIAFRLKDAKAVYLELKGKKYVYPEQEKIDTFKICSKSNSSTVLEIPEGILSCYPLREELVSQLLGKPKRIGTFSILFKKGFYLKIKRKWLLKRLLAFFILFASLIGGYFYLYRVLQLDLFFLEKLIKKVKSFLQASSEHEVEKLLKEMKKDTDKIFFKEFKSVANLILNMSKTLWKLSEKLKKEAVEDPLTGLFNRNYLKKFAKKIIYLAKRENMYISVAMLDIDDFKSINDTFGHQKGDEVLKTLGEIIKNRIRSSDIPIRYGGEEFLILFINSKKKESAIVLEDIKNKLSLVDFGIGKSVTFSAGVASFPEDVKNFSSLNELIELADERLYVAKKTGKNRIVWK